MSDEQTYLEELVKQEGEPVGEHLLSDRLRPGRDERNNRGGKSERLWTDGGRRLKTEDTEAAGSKRHSNV